MHYNISFPNLGIYLDHVGKSISVFGFEIAYYGIIIGLAILIGFLIATSEAKRTRQNPEDYLDMGIIGVIAGIAGARIFYVVFSWDMYKDNLLDIFNLREGGLAIYGGVIAAVIAVFIMARVKHLSPFQILDTVAMAILNGQMLGRWGNFFNREAFGEYTDSLFAMRLPLGLQLNLRCRPGAHGADRRSELYPGTPHIPLRVTVVLRPAHYPCPVSEA